MGSPSAPVERNVGFQFLRHTQPTPQAYEDLVVYIRETPSVQHFDPETLDLRVWTAEGGRGGGGVQELTLHHPWPVESRYRAVLGRLILRDRAGESVEGFTFGGTLDVAVEADLTRCQLHSEAPLFDLAEPGTLSALLVSEVEVDLAELRGRAVDRLDRIEFALGRHDPTRIYAACLTSVNEKMRSFDHQELLEYRGLHRLVRKEIERLREQGKWPAKTVRLSDLLLKEAGPISHAGQEGQD